MESPVDEEAKKKSLRSIPYGLFILTAKHGDDVAAATVNWVTQSSFKPPLVAVGIKCDSHPYSTVKAAGNFAINVLGEGQKDLAQAFFMTVKPEGNKLGPVTFNPGATGAPILNETPAYWECRLVDVVEQGDHHLFIGEVVEAGVKSDDKTLLMRDTGWNYGG
jgi:flavin reductase (DIM6/NTAB) family NADH-FMN oxidoreductase RutF